VAHVVELYSREGKQPIMRNASFAKIFGLLISGAALVSPGYSQTTDQIVANSDDGNSQSSLPARARPPANVLIMTLPTRANAENTSSEARSSDSVTSMPFRPEEVQPK
jgi:hypothetical protein